MRAFSRFVVDQDIGYKIGGQKNNAMLYNLSCGGCMIETTNPEIEQNRPIEIELSGEATTSGTVVWRVGKHAGIKFDTLVDQSVVETMGYIADTEEFDRDDPRDRFGIPLLG